MTSNHQYQQLFANLKGVGYSGLRGFVLPVRGTDHVLEPVNCSEDHVSMPIVELLTHARNANAGSFLTKFEATPQRTRDWLVGTVADDPGRILFVVRHIESGAYYGYMGLAFGNDDGTYIEADAIVRTKAVAVRGLMKRAFKTMIGWVGNDLGIKNTWVRVLSDNPAVGFYESCGFATRKICGLFEVTDDLGVVCALAVDPDSDRCARSGRSLSYMQLEQ